MKTAFLRCLSLCLLPVLMELGCSSQPKKTSSYSSAEIRALSPDAAKKILVASGYDISPRGLISAVRKNEYFSVLFYFQAGLSPDVRVSSGAYTASMIAAQDSSRVDILNLLLERGADPNARYADGSTPLHFAAQAGNNDAIVVLRRYNADMSARAGFQQQTPLEMAQSIPGHASTASMFWRDTNLSEQDKWGQTPLMQAIAAKNRTLIDQLIEANVDVSIVDRVGHNALSVAAQNGDLETVQKLIARGCKVHQVDVEGRTPLHIAALEGHVEIVKALSAAGAVLSSLDQNGHTPRSLAAMYASHSAQHKAIVAYFEQLNAL